LEEKLIFFALCGDLIKKFKKSQKNQNKEKNPKNSKKIKKIYDKKKKYNK